VEKLPLPLRGNGYDSENGATNFGSRTSESINLETQVTKSPFNKTELYVPELQGQTRRVCRGPVDIPGRRQGSAPENRRNTAAPVLVSEPRAVAAAYKCTQTRQHLKF